MRIRPYWTLMARSAPASDCQALIELVNELGWQGAAYADGRPRGNVTVRHLQDGDGPVAREWLAAFRQMAALYAPAFGVDVSPENLTSFQVSRWREGDHYEMHADHDASGNLAVDRKMSLYVALSPGGGLEVHGVGKIHCNTGDALAFASYVNHGAPVQGPGERFSAVAWVPGPDWR